MAGKKSSKRTKKTSKNLKKKTGTTKKSSNKRAPPKAKKRTKKSTKSIESTKTKEIAREEDSVVQNMEETKAIPEDIGENHINEEELKEQVVQNQNEEVSEGANEEVSEGANEEVSEASIEEHGESGTTENQDLENPGTKNTPDLEEEFKKELMDFSELDELDDEDLLELEEAFEELKESSKKSDIIYKTPAGVEEKSKEDTYPGWGLYPEIDKYPGWGLYELGGDFNPEISEDLERKIQAELELKRKQKKLITEEMFKEKCKANRTKIWYHALWHLVFKSDDHKATKEGLYEFLKEVTSKSAIDPIPKHKFFFGLGFILRLKLEDKPVVIFNEGNLELNVGVDQLIDILQEVGAPISTRPIITEEEKRNMFLDFLTDDFDDI